MPHFDSLCVREGKDLRTTKPHIQPVYLTSSFDLESIDQGIRIFTKEEKGHVYGRYGNPTMESVADRIAKLECYDSEFEASAIMCSSGMAAIHTLCITLLHKDDVVLTQGNLYGGTTELFKKIMSRGGIEIIQADLTDLSAVEDILKSRKVNVVYFETPANPTCSCIDIAGVSELAHQFHAKVVVDNTFATPYLQRPFKFGADFIIHSATKHLNGHGNAIAGVIIGRDREFMEARVWETMKLAGTNASPMDSWLIQQGLKTLPLRMERHSQNARSLATFLESHQSVSQVNYTGLVSHPHHDLAMRQMDGHGGLLSFELKGGLEAGIKAIRKLKFCTLAPTLGDVDTLVLHPASMSHLNIPKEDRIANGITDGLIRVSVGIEHVDDIISDVEQAIG